MLFTNITIRRIACFLRESTKISAALAIIYGFFLSFWFSGRYNSPRTKYWEECMFQTQKYKNFQSFANHLKAFSWFSVVIESTKIGYLPTKQWEESHVSDAKVQQFGSLAINYGFFSIFFFFFFFFFFGSLLLVMNKILRRLHVSDAKIQQQKFGLLSIINSFFLSFCCYCTNKNMLFTNKTVRRIACFRRKSTKISARSLAQQLVGISRVSGFLSV